MKLVEKYVGRGLEGVWGRVRSGYNQDMMYMFMRNSKNAIKIKLKYIHYDRSDW